MKKFSLLYMALCFMATSMQGWYHIVSYKDLLNMRPDMSYQACYPQIDYNFTPFSLSPKHPHQGYFKELYTLFIPHGFVQGNKGYVYADNLVVQELFWQGLYETFYDAHDHSGLQVKHVPGKLAVIAQQPQDVYFHWVLDVFARLAVLEMGNIDYDWLYVNPDSSVKQETLDLWGVDRAKIVKPEGERFCVQADILVVPCMPMNSNVYFCNSIGSQTHPDTTRYVRDKLLNAVLEKTKGQEHSFPEKIFITRKDATQSRRISNEDEVFELFEAKGFVRYRLADLSFIDQVLLFHNAKVVVAEHGSGLTNIVFCKPGTKIIEIFQRYVESCFWWQSAIFNLDYTAVKLCNNDTWYAAQKRSFGTFLGADWSAVTHVSVDALKPIVEML
ncbi:glycosyltransferase family 61 protein [Candidatus Babeliales bacterium]|nr:glycosyltransferase family 61 protein [Candidatus Babeliales bacterium]